MGFPPKKIGSSQALLALKLDFEKLKPGVFCASNKDAMIFNADAPRFKEH